MNIKRGLIGMIAFSIVVILMGHSGTAQTPPAFLEGEIVVKFQPGLGIASMDQLLQSQGLETKMVLPYSGVRRISVPPGQEIEIAARLEERSDIQFAHPNYWVQGAKTPNDPHFNLQWALQNTGQAGGISGADIGASEAWDIHTGSADIIVAIVDSGVDLDHPDFQGKLTSGYDFVNNDAWPDDDQGHGTHVAGIAAASGNNGVGVTGVSWGAKVMPVKVLNQFNTGLISDVAEGINYAIAQDADVINLSVAAAYSSYPCNGFQLLQAAMQNALANDVLVVVSAGNEGQASVDCPAALDEAFAVGWTTPSDTRSFLSNYGSRLDIAAPGSQIYSTVLDGYNYKEGTSMAAPYVTGLVALLKSVDASLQPPDLRSIIQMGAKDLGAAGRDDFYGYGRIDAYRSMEMVVELRTTPTEISYLVGNNSPPLTPTDIDILSGAANQVSWTAAISPTVSWLNLGPTNGVVSAGSSPTSIQVTPTLPGSYGVYTTTVVVEGSRAGLSLGTRTTEIKLSYVDADIQTTYLPIIAQQGSLSAADLIVKNAAIAEGQLLLQIENQGSEAISDPFWIDVYFDPVTEPQFNQPWPKVADSGQVWGVQDVTLAPEGGSVILQTGDSYYHSEYSRDSIPESVEKIYILVDSVNYNTDYGAIQESNEKNNLYEISLTSPTVSVMRLNSVETGNPISISELPVRIEP